MSFIPRSETLQYFFDFENTEFVEIVESQMLCRIPKIGTYTRAYTDCKVIVIYFTTRVREH